ncbi:glycerophosphodiester phosphodiesterase family protein [Sinisalibacter aestuarii]|uniref:Phosphodiesterase n=1 Tax=Sinisalibacter aestuarii TaxID=2949426 RepID=A0ABQ5LUZ1_9RHOB|nr:glycerophosphodiester phosphodiesterase family protein [Sinisalibacter aestuarii]GKY88789.1 phosphodiesterase [Sinisalibacter aestuarii]
MLPEAFLLRPLAHRGYHDLAAGRPENSRAAIAAAVAAGYGIEIDVQLAADGVAMVFHDPVLGRMTGAQGHVHARTAAELGQIPISGGDEGIPTLDEVLALVAGRAPLLIEIKAQSHQRPRGIASLEEDVTRALSGYAGPVAVMSFNPQVVARMAALAPGVPRGLTTYDFDDEETRALPADLRARLAGIEDFDAAQASFISHDVADLASPRVAALKRRGVPVLCWTVTSPEMETKAREVADNITFEGYAAALPA